MKQKAFIIGAILLIASAVWFFALAPRWTHRVPLGWSYVSSFIGISTWADSETGTFPDQDVLNTYERSISALSENATDDSIMLEDSYITRDLETGAVTWKAVFMAPVDPKTGSHLSDEFRGAYFVFPRNVEKKPYVITSNYIRNVEFIFDGEEVLEDIQVYRFVYQGTLNYAFSYASTEVYEGIDVEPGQEIKCWDDQLVEKLWVEPVTGEILKTLESCLSGDYVYDLATGAPIYPLARWAGESAGDDLQERAAFIRAERAKILWLSRYIPSLLFISGLIFLGLGAFSAIKKKANSGDK
jgi:hypothetical protein